MKLRHILAPAAAVFLATSSANAQLLHYYNFSEGAESSVVYDQVGSANGGLNLGGVAQVNGYLQLQGYSQPGYVQFSDWLVPVEGAWTVSFFARAEPNSNGLARILSQGSSGHGFYMGPWGSNNWNTDFWPYVAGPFYQDNEWHSYTLTTDLDQARFYIDGILADTHGAIVFDNGYGTPFRIGGQFGGYGEWFDGDVDNVRIYGSAISAEEALEIGGTYQNNVAPEPGSIMLVATGLLGLIALRRRQQAS